MNYTCDICYSENIMNCNVCPNSSDDNHSKICELCLVTYIKTKIDDMYNGICSPIFCPTCTTSKPILMFKRWSAIDTLYDHADRYVQFAQNLVTFRCGECHEETCVDPLYRDDITIDENLKKILNKYVHNKLEIIETYKKICDYCDLHEDTFIDIVTSIENPERRIALFLCHLRHFPYISTYCCDSLHCFKCKIQMREGHDHICDSLEKFSDMNEISQCPSCNMNLVKSEGCNLVLCVCGESFNWTEQLQKYKSTNQHSFSYWYPINTDYQCAKILISSEDKISLDWYENNINNVENHLMDIYLSTYPNYPVHKYLSNTITNKWLCIGGKIYTKNFIQKYPHKYKIIMRELTIAKKESALLKKLLFPKKSKLTVEKAIDLTKSFLFLLNQKEVKMSGKSIFLENDTQYYLYKGISELLRLLLEQLNTFDDCNKTEIKNSFFDKKSAEFEKMFNNFDDFENIVNIDEIVRPMIYRRIIINPSMSMFNFDYMDHEPIFPKIKLKRTMLTHDKYQRVPIFFDCDNSSIKQCQNLKRIELIIKRIYELENNKTKSISLRIFANFCAILQNISNLSTCSEYMIYDFIKISDVYINKMKITWNIIVCGISWYFSNEYTIKNIIQSTWQPYIF